MVSEWLKVGLKGSLDSVKVGVMVIIVQLDSDKKSYSVSDIRVILYIVVVFLI